MQTQIDNKFVYSEEKMCVLRSSNLDRPGTLFSHGVINNHFINNEITTKVFETINY